MNNIDLIRTRGIQFAMIPRNQKLVGLDYFSPGAPTERKVVHRDEAEIRVWMFLATLGMLLVGFIFFAVLFLGFLAFW